MGALHNLYERKVWTDVNIRCKDHVTDDPDDRLRAHKIILAARSPVFSAMFYGPTSNGNSELDLTEYNKETVDAFLRYVYYDDEPVQTDIAIDLFKIAHFFQVTMLLERCCGVLLNGLTTENACPLLEMAMLYDASALNDCIIDFIDEHAEVVLESDGFLSISNDTLEFMLKGDTLFADEVVIVTNVYRWARNKLTTLNKTLNRRHVRELLGRLSYLLRIPRMSLEEFIKLESQYSFHTRKECLDITNSLLTGKHQQLSCHIHEKRVAKTELFSLTDSQSSIPFVFLSRSFCTSDLNIINIRTKRSVTVASITVVVPQVATEHHLNNSRGYTSLQCSCPFEIKLECRQAAFEQRKTITVQCGNEINLSLDPRLSLEGSLNKEYTIKVTVNCPMIPQLCFGTRSSYKNVTNVSENEDISKVTVQTNSLITRLVLSQPSGRNRNIAETAVNISNDTYCGECDAELESEFQA